MAVTARQRQAAFALPCVDEAVCALPELTAEEWRAVIDDVLDAEDDWMRAEMCRMSRADAIAFVRKEERWHGVFGPFGPSWTGGPDGIIGWTEEYEHLPPDRFGFPRFRPVCFLRSSFIPWAEIVDAAREAVTPLRQMAFALEAAP
jgi:hypothetical protein